MTGVVNLAIVALAVLAVAAAVLLRHRSSAAARDGARLDSPAVVLVTLVRLLDGDRVEWGRAMLGELAQLRRRAERWRFVLSCARAVLVVPPRRGDFGRPTLAVILAAAAGSIGFVGYGLLRYPGLVTGARTWLLLALFLGVVAGYTLIAFVLVRRGGGAAAGLLGGLGVASVWFLVALVMVNHAAKPAFMLLLLAIPVTTLAFGAITGWLGATPAAGRSAALLASIVAGLAAFVVYVGDTTLTAGRPYDPGEIRDFATSGASDLATYAVNDNLGSAMMLLLLIPLVTALAGCTGVAAAHAIRRRSPTALASDEAD